MNPSVALGFEGRTLLIRGASLLFASAHRIFSCECGGATVLDFCACTVQLARIKFRGLQYAEVPPP